MSGGYSPIDRRGSGPYDQPTSRMGIPIRPSNLSFAGNRSTSSSAPGPSVYRPGPPTGSASPYARDGGASPIGTWPGSRPASTQQPAETGPSRPFIHPSRQRPASPPRQRYERSPERSNRDRPPTGQDRGQDDRDRDRDRGRDHAGPSSYASTSRRPGRSASPSRDSHRQAPFPDPRPSPRPRQRETDRDRDRQMPPPPPREPAPTPPPLSSPRENGQGSRPSSSAGMPGDDASGDLRTGFADFHKAYTLYRRADEEFAARSLWLKEDKALHRDERVIADTSRGVDDAKAQRDRAAERLSKVVIRSVRPMVEAIVKSLPQVAAPAPASVAAPTSPAAVAAPVDASTSSAAETAPAKVEDAAAAPTTAHARASASAPPDSTASAASELSPERAARSAALRNRLSSIEAELESTRDLFVPNYEDRFEWLEQEADMRMTENAAFRQDQVILRTEFNQLKQLFEDQKAVWEKEKEEIEEKAAVNASIASQPANSAEFKAIQDTVASLVVRLDERDKAEESAQAENDALRKKVAALESESAQVKAENNALAQRTKDIEAKVAEATLIRENLRVLHDTRDREIDRRLESLQTSQTNVGTQITDAATKHKTLSDRVQRLERSEAAKEQDAIAESRARSDLEAKMDTAMALATKADTLGRKYEAELSRIIVNWEATFTPIESALRSQWRKDIQDYHRPESQTGGFQDCQQRLPPLAPGHGPGPSNGFGSRTASGSSQPAARPPPTAPGGQRPVQNGVPITNVNFGGQPPGRNNAPRPITPSMSPLTYSPLPAPSPAVRVGPTPVIFFKARKPSPPGMDPHERIFQSQGLYTCSFYSPLLDHLVNTELLAEKIAAGGSEYSGVIASSPRAGNAWIQAYHAIQTAGSAPMQWDRIPLWTTGAVTTDSFKPTNASVPPSAIPTPPKGPLPDIANGEQLAEAIVERVRNKRVLLRKGGVARFLRLVGSTISPEFDKVISAYNNSLADTTAPRIEIHSILVYEARITPRLEQEVLPLVKATRQSSSQVWLVFFSYLGAEAIVRTLRSAGVLSTASSTPGFKIATIGMKTAQQLRDQSGITVHTQGSLPMAEHLYAAVAASDGFTVPQFIQASNTMSASPGPSETRSGS